MQTGVKVPGGCTVLTRAVGLLARSGQMRASPFARGRAAVFPAEEGLRRRRRLRA